MLNRLRWGCVAAAVAILAACGGGGGSDTPLEPEVPVEQLPVAKFIYTPKQVAVGQPVTLDASQSTSPGEHRLSYQWSIVERAGQATLTGANEPVATFLASDAGTYVIGLTVNDGRAESKIATQAIEVIDGNVAPVAHAGPDQHVATGSLVTLDGSASSDANGDPLTYAWTILDKPTGSAATLSDAAAVRPMFTVDLEGDYVVALVVNDGKLDSERVTVTISAYAQNVPPVADAGKAQNVTTGTLVRLDGSGSHDANGDTLTYVWTFGSRPVGSEATLSQADTARPSFTPDVPGKYVVMLVVNDGQVDSAAASVEIIATQANVPPVADAGADIEQEVGTIVTLDGSASHDANGDALTYQWTLISKPVGSRATLSNTEAVRPTFTADLVGDYVAHLQVTDVHGARSEKDSVTIRIVRGNVAPVAYPGANQQVVEGALVTLNGSGSSDTDGDALSYRWRFVSLPGGSKAVLHNATAVQTTFTADKAGTYVIELVVNDGRTDSEPARVTVTVDPANAAPVANAGAAQRVATGSLVTLDGSASSDAEGAPLTYRWTLTGKPVGSSAVLVGADTVSPSFTADRAGDYVATLVVNDGVQDSEPAQVVITATAGLRLYTRDGLTGWRESSLPYSANVAMQGTYLGTSVIELAAFRLKAEIGQYTLVDVSATSSPASAVQPRFEGLAEGKVIAEGETVTFRLLSNKTNGQTVNMTYRFAIKETGETFTYSGQFNLR